MSSSSPELGSTISETPQPAPTPLEVLTGILQKLYDVAEELSQFLQTYRQAIVCP